MAGLFNGVDDGVQVGSGHDDHRGDCALDGGSVDDDGVQEG
ncbi:hypothetical protein [Streptomyces sp. SLBN-31]|nr:hypothetical protein [Streptomyces sp. SLBN-31]